MMGCETEVQAAMARVEASLDEAASLSGRPRGVIHLRPEGDREVNVGRLRHRADIDLDLPSGSDRPLVGGIIRLAKRATRRAIGWYARPIMDQQSRFNHGTLDLIERLRLRLAQVSEGRGEPVRVGEPGPGPGRYPEPEMRVGAYLPLFGGCRKVVHVECDGGHLLSALARVGTAAYGVSLDQRTVEAARVDGLEVELDDPVEHLRRLEPGSVDGLFCSLVAAPRSARELVALLEAASRSMPTGVLVIETADAETAAAPDAPSRDVAMRPFHSLAVEAALVATGFTGVRTETVGASPEPPRASTSGSSLAEEIERIDDLFRRRRVAAVVATKSVTSG